MWYADPGGFRIAVPKFWAYTRDDSTAYFREPGSERTIAVGEWKPPGDNLVAAFEKEEADGVKAPGYQRVRIDPVTSAFPTAAEWEYTFDGPDDRRLHAVNRGFRTAGGRAFVIMWQTSDFDFQTNQANYQLMTVSFTPPA